MSVSAIDTSINIEKELEEAFRCQTCSKVFSNIDQLYAHQNELGHLELKQTPRGPGYLCWKKGCNQYFKTAQAVQMHFREIHAKRMSLQDRSVYKYQCGQCTLAFLNPEKLQLHAHIHLIKSALVCNFCTKSFQSILAMKKHVAVTHDLNDAELEQYNAKVNVNVMALATLLSNSGLNTKLFINSETPRQNGMDSSKSDIAKDSERMDTDDSDEMPGMNSEYSSKDNSLSSTPVSMENGIDKVTNSDGLDKDMNDMNSTEQIMFEDYINSQAFAEGAYEDPNRKYKCHRCKVAFTKQNYLYAHNKTLLHKQGERLSYPMEKYLDPNRPYKCDVCLESFTQKNILLVHYNSVSHLHKVKQTSQSETSSSSSSLSSSALPLVSAPSVISATSSPSMASTSEKKERPAKSSDAGSAEDDILRPYKCNICKVSYSQGSTLDIHIRSVGHQTKASKLQELAITGEIDLSKPLIEEPSTQAQQQKLINEFLSMQTSMAQMTQASMLFQGLPSGLPGLPGIPSISGLPLIPGLPPLLPMSLPNQMIPLSSSNTSHSSSTSKSSLSSLSEVSSPGNKFLDKNSQNHTPQRSIPSSETSSSIKGSSAMSASTQSQNAISGNVHVCQFCCSVFGSQEAFNQHHPYCSVTSPSPSMLNQQLNTPAKGRVIWRIKPHVQRNLLENFGFECVMQFNEFNQPTVKKEGMKVEDDDNTDSESDDEENPGDKKQNNPANDDRKEEDMDTEDAPKLVIDENNDKVKEEAQDEDKVDLPEMNKCVCSTCSKQFSSVWVLKAHQEEVHKDIVPLEMVEDVGDQFKTDLESRIPKEPELPPVPPTPSTPVEEPVVKQEMPPPPIPQPQVQMDMLQMMGMFGMMPMPMPGLMMNTQHPMMPMMVPPPSMDQGLKSPNLPGLDSSAAAQLSAQHKQQLAAQQAAMANQKRARTRINDEQLKVLRGYFDINNSPSEEQIQAMSEQTTLPMKVIKHWFRNTLFKERQRNKDSPYNFNNPPSTTLDLEEYEKTGKLSIIENPQELEALNSDSPALKTEDLEPKVKMEEMKEELKVQPKQDLPVPVPKELSNPHASNPHNPGHSEGNPHSNPHSNPTSTPTNPQPNPHPVPNPAPPKERHESQPSSSRSPSPTTHDSLMDSMGSLSSQGGGPLMPSYPPASTTPVMPPLYEHHNYSPPGGASGRRANRTRFTDYQVRVLQEYFEQNAYPKDDELEHLSKMLKLSPRVIVVWFQNARQKARKIYENQPADNREGQQSSSGTAPFQKTSGLNYQCKKCSDVFHRYYDLIRHQKRSCFTDAERQESHMSDDSDSLSHTTSLDDMYFSDHESEASSHVSKTTTPAATVVTESGPEPPKYTCEKCDMSFNRLELWREHQNVHSMNPGLFMNFPSNSAFDVLQNMAAAQQQHGLEASLKRKYEEERDDDPDQPRDKRLRTTILPEQLDYLYQKYQIDCNPSRKQLEAISKDVGLKKRVVQVWFQNTRARERKGQYRAHQQLIHKRCPICRALFRAKSALESHLATKHPDEMAKGEINVDAIPDAAIESPGPGGGGSYPSSISPPEFNPLMTPPGMQGLLPLLPPGNMPGMTFPPMADPIQMSMKQFYEDSFKKYINELSSTPIQKGGHPLMPPEINSTPIKPDRLPEEDDAPLDLSKPVKKENRSESKHRESTSTSSALGNALPQLDQSSMMPRFGHSSMSDSVHSMDYRDDESSNISSNPASPGQSHHHLSSANKRYRTQMTSLQVRIMKSIFVDYKTPTMAECEMLGRIIGLQKRVVQVWFQNARAKEKKAKLNMAKSYGQSDMDFPKPPEECTLCNFKYSHKYTIQDHIFTKKHIDKLRAYIQTQSDAERELTHSSMAMSGASGLLRSQQSTESEAENMMKLMEKAGSSQSQMAQLQSLGLPLGLPPGPLPGIVAFIIILSKQNQTFLNPRKNNKKNNSNN